MLKIEGVSCAVPRACREHSTCSIGRSLASRSRRVMQIESHSELEFSLRMSRRTPWIRVWAGLLLVAFWSGETASAWASCGDYVTIESPHSQITLADSHRFLDSVPRDFRPQTPCHGPECQQRRQSVPAAPVPPTLIQRIEYATLADFLFVELGLERQWREHETDATPGLSSGTGIDRPPR